MNKRGMTFIELIISMVLIGIVSVVSTEFLAQYKRMASASSMKVKIASWSREKMEGLYMDNIDSWAPGTDTSGGMTRTTSKTVRADYTVIKVTTNK